MAKRDNNSSSFKDWTNKKLKDTFKDLKDMELNNPDNFDYKDFHNLRGIRNELEEREIYYHFGIIFD